MGQTTAVGKSSGKHKVPRYDLEVVAFHSVGSSTHLIIASNSAVVSFRRQHHVQLGLVGASLALVLGVKGQGQRVVVTQVDFLPVPEEPDRERADH